MTHRLPSRGETAQTLRNVLLQHLEGVWSTPGLEEQEKCERKGGYLCAGKGTDGFQNQTGPTVLGSPGRFCWVSSA